MGTSTSHPSPDTIGWRAAQAGYRSKAVSIDRLTQELFRASQSQPDPLSGHLSAPIIFSCQEAVREARSAADTAARISGLLAKSKQNTFVAELAKRAAVIASRSPDPVSAWRTSFFSQVADYLVSRDASGFVGRSYRARTVPELMNLKGGVLKHVREAVSQVSGDPRSPEQWSSYVGAVLTQLTGRP